MKKNDKLDIQTQRKLREIDSKLAPLEIERGELISDRQALLERDAHSAKNKADTTETLSVDEKVALFSCLFRGREDIFATRWQNKNGRSGYSVTCHNEWGSKDL